MNTAVIWALGALAAALLLLLLAATLALLSFALRGTPVRRIRRWDRAPHGAGPPDGGDEAEVGHSPVAASDPEFCELLAVLCGTNLAGGHDVRCFFSGDELFTTLFDELAKAQRLIVWHVFWFKPGTLADRLADILVDRARAGVRVYMLLDNFGSKGIGDTYIARLREGGVLVEVFRPLRWNTLHKAQNRMHVRTVVIDSDIGYTGGFGIDDRWRGDGRHRGQWRDTSVRVVGTAVMQLEAAFISSWGEATGDLLMGPRLVRSPEPGTTDVRAGLMNSSPSLGSTMAERFFFSTIAAARAHCWITTAYFVADRHFRRLLCATAGRGVDVRVLTPGRNTDRPSTWHAARAHYDELLEAGVRLFEYRPTMLHAKTLVVDGTVAMIGTLNFDNRSMVLNDEVALLTWGPEVAGELVRAFERDLAFADEVTRESHARRPWWPCRPLEIGAAAVARLL